MTEPDQQQPPQTGQDAPTPPTAGHPMPTPHTDQPPAQAAGVPPSSSEPSRVDAPATGDASETQRLRDELDEMRRRLEASESDKTQAVASALAQARGDQSTNTSKMQVDLSDKSQAERAEHFKDWPQRGGDLPQPWDNRALGLHTVVRDFERDSKPGSPNTVSPIVIHHGKPILSHGSSDPAVHELGRTLGALGFPNSVSDGENAFGSVDNTVMAAVHAFRDAYNVQEDPTGWGGDTPDGRSRAAAHIGPWTWEAILRAGAHAAGELAGNLAHR